MIEIKSFNLLTGTQDGMNFLPDEEGLICLGVELPEKWDTFSNAVLTLRANSNDKVIVHFGLAENEESEPVFSFNYSVLQKCLVNIPYFLDKRTLQAEAHFLPPWPGCFKGRIAGTSLRSGVAHYAKITIRSQSLNNVESIVLSFVNDWKPTDVVGEVLIDEFGQCKDRTWARKTTSIEELSKELKAEYEAAKKNSSYPEGWSKWGGYLGKKLTATGWFHTEKYNNRWWLVDPDGYVFFSNAACYGNRTGIYAMEDHLDALYEKLPPKEGLFKACWASGDMIPQYVVRNGLENAKTRMLVNFPRFNMMRVFGEEWLDAWITINTARMKAAGLNTLGIGVNDYADEYTKEFVEKSKIPYVITVKYYPLTEDRIFRDFPDVFDPEYEVLAMKAAHTSLDEYLDDPYFIGYFTTNEPEWYFYPDVNLTLKLLASEKCMASKKEFVNFLKTRYENLEALNKAWGTAFAEENDLLKPLLIDNPSEIITKDTMDFHRILVEKYGDVISGCFRKVDPHHLNLGMRYAGLSDKTAEKVFGEATCKFDVFSFNRYGTDPVEQANVVERHCDIPTVVGEWHIGATDAGLDVGGLYFTDTQKERAKACTYYLEQSTQPANLVGIHYFEYSDQPYLGRFDGECYQIGLIDVCNRIYPETMEAFQQFAKRMYPMLLGECKPEMELIPLQHIKS